MYLSDRDLKFAVETGQLIVKGHSGEYDTTSIDLHLDTIDEAKVWDVDAFEKKQKESGNYALLRVGQFELKPFTADYGRPVPEDKPESSNRLVFRNGHQVIVRPGGFFLWQTKEVVGTPENNPRLICFIDGKSTRARTGLLVHMTAPTIHAGWWGNVTLEIANLGPFTLALAEGDAIAQIVVAAISSPPLERKKATAIAIGQRTVAGESPLPKKKL